MNKFTKALVLGTAAIATLAATMEIAPAADWQNRGFRGHPWRYHHGHYYHNGVAAGIITGMAAPGGDAALEEQLPLPVIQENGAGGFRAKLAGQ